MQKLDVALPKRSKDRALKMLIDFRYAIRQFVKTPTFALIAIITLALGIGANTAMFSILNGVLLKPLPYPEQDQLERIYRVTPQEPRGGISPADYLDLKAQANAYGEVAAYGSLGVSLSEPGQPAEMVTGVRVSTNLLSTLEVQPQLGRNFHPDEVVAGNHRVLMLSNRYWRNRFGADPSVIGRTVRIDGEANEIVGILPATFNDWRHLGWADLFRPLGLTESETSDRSSAWLRVIARRTEAQSRAAADDFVASFGQRLAADFPAVNAESTWHAVPLRDTIVGRTEGGPTVISLLVGLSGFVLLIACSNLANLMLARTVARSREFAVRAALGASRFQLLRSLIVESLVLATAGGLCAVVVARWASDWLAVRSTGDNGERVILALDGSVLGWAFAASLVTALAFGVAPALVAMRLDLAKTLKSGSRGMTGGRGHQRFRQLLIVGQFALAMVLLAGAGLFVRGLDDLNNRRLGWESEHLVTGTILLPLAAYPEGSEISAFQELALERLEALPGVASASVSYAMPFFGLGEARKYLVEGLAAPKPGHEPVALINGVTSRYFETVGTRLLEGRTFTGADTATSPKVLIINQAMARGLFGGESPLGRRLAGAGGETVEWGEIVGVVSDTQSVFPDPGPVTYQLYQPMAQEARRLGEIAVRTSGVPPETLVNRIRATMMSLEPDLPVRRLQPADASISRANYQDAVLGSMLSGLSILGLGLAALGVYGVIARTTAQRAGEFGIRLALGARLIDITRLVLASGMKLALIGSALGLLGGIGVARLIAAGSPGLRTDSVPVMAGVTFLLVGIALLSCWLPARRAGRVDPAIALRAE
ncbi:MAG: ABC transporter permease [Vicinamibacteria bacterium]|nr:ABC transporter permease [Vicinamibacteria bacterium]